MSVSVFHFCVSIKRYFHHYINSEFKGVFRFGYLVWLWIYFLCIHISNSEIKWPFRYFGNDFRKLIFGSLTFDFRRTFSASLFSVKQIFASKIRIHFPESEISMMLNWWLVKFVFKVETREGSQNFRFRSITQSLFHFQIRIDQPISGNPKRKTRIFISYSDWWKFLWFLFQKIIIIIIKSIA